MTPKPKLLYAVHPPLRTQGGVSVLAREFITRFSQQFQVYLLSNDLPDDLRGDEIYPCLSGHIFTPNPQRLRYIFRTKEIAEEINEHQIDLVHFHSGFYCWGNLVPGFSLPGKLRKLGIPSMWTTHSGLRLMEGFSNPHLPILLKAPLFVGVWLGKLDQIRNTRFEIQVSRNALDKLKRCWFPVASHCLHIYHSRIDSRFDGHVARNQSILNVGYISFAKRQELLVKAFLTVAGKFPDCELLLAGPDNADGCMDAIQHMIAGSRMADRIRFLGERPDVGILMRECGVFVHCSDAEGLPLAVQEAMYSSCAVVASDIPAHRELIEDAVSGLLFEQGSAAGLAICLERLLSDESLRVRMGENAKSAILRNGMTKDRMFSRYEKLYSQILSLATI